MCVVMGAVMALAILTCTTWSSAEPIPRTCEPIRVEMCTGLGYNVTGMPNLVGHERQTDAVIILRSFEPLIEYGCSAQLKFFLCSVYVPMCTDKVANPIGPCRGLCERVRSRCFPVLQGFGFSWPPALNCSLFPAQNDHQHMCMEGPGETTRSYSSAPTGVGPCARLPRPNMHVFLNRSERCVPFCGADVLFDSADKALAEVWLSVWAALCVASSVVALVTLLVEAGARRSYPHKPLMFLALCYVSVGAGWAVRSAAGRAAVACRADVTASGRLLLAYDGFTNPNCAVVFLLTYYFGMAADVWWVILCVCWVLSAGLRWTPDRIQALSSYLHLGAWGIPAAHTVAALVRRDVDADELTGICHVGRQNSVTLLWLVLVPHTALLITGAALLAAGAILVSRRPRALPLPTAPTAASPVAAARRTRFGTDLLKLRVFGVLYMFPAGCVLASYAYEYWGRSSWLAGESRPLLWIFLVRVFMSLVAGVTAAMWAWTPRTVSSWRAFLGRVFPQPAYRQPPLKCPPPAPVIRCAPPKRPPTELPLRQQPRHHKHRPYRVYHQRSGSETVI